MSEENDNNANFDKAITDVKNLRGGVKAFVLVALAAEKDDAGKQNAVSAMAGKKAEIVALAGEIGETIMKDIVLKDLLGEE